MGLFLSCGLLAMTGCGKENNDEILDANSFYVEMAPMVDESGSKVTFSSNSYLNLLYDEGDKIYVNNEPFTLRKKGGKWVAQGSSSSMTNATRDTLLGTGFSCIYTQSPASIQSYSSSTGNYDVEFITQTDTSGYFTYYNSGIVLAGRTSDSLVTMYPSFAVIRFYTTRMTTIDKLYVGFDDNVPVKRATVSPKSGMPVLSNVQSEMYAPGGETDEFGTNAWGDLLYAVKNGVNEGGRYAYHVIVPLASSSVSTDLYIGWKLTTGQVGSKKTTSKVTLRRGVVYTVNL